MTLIELCSEFYELVIPNDAEIFIEADHGQSKEPAYSIVVSRTPRDSEEFGDPEAMIWEYSNYQDMYDEEGLEVYDTKAPITAVLICS